MWLNCLCHKLNDTNRSLGRWQRKWGNNRLTSWKLKREKQTGKKGFFVQQNLEVNLEFPVCVCPIKPLFILFVTPDYGIISPHFTPSTVGRYQQIGVWYDIAFFSQNIDISIFFDITKLISNLPLKYRYIDSVRYFDWLHWKKKFFLVLFGAVQIWPHTFWVFSAPPFHKSPIFLP